MINRVWVLGDAVIDLVPENANGYLKCPARAWRWASPGSVATAPLSGGWGKTASVPLQQVLSDEGVDIGHMRPDPEHHTSTVVVDLDLQGERSFTFMVQPSADLFCSLTICRISNGEWLHLCSIALSQEPSRSAAFAAMERIRAAGGRVSFDPNIREEVWRQPEALRPCLQRRCCWRTW